MVDGMKNDVSRLLTYDLTKSNIRQNVKKQIQAHIDKLKIQTKKLSYATLADSGCKNVICE